jgi:hypothetical protein
MTRYTYLEAIIPEIITEIIYDLSIEEINSLTIVLSDKMNLKLINIFIDNKCIDLIDKNIHYGIFL